MKCEDVESLISIALKKAGTGKFKLKNIRLAKISDEL
jgi:hypothetical protein